MTANGTTTGDCPEGIDPALLTLLPDLRQVVARGGGPGALPPPPPADEMLPAEMRTVPGRPTLGVRVIAPPAAPRAVMLAVHGGGFAVGNAAMEDHHGSVLARALGIVSVSVEYRLAPAHPHPAALEDCLATALWLARDARAEFGTDRLLIGGASVGATLSVLTLLAWRDRHGAATRFSGADLRVGTYDFSMTPSQRHSHDGLFLSPERLRGTVAAAFPGRSGEQLRDPQISALYADLQGLPPALFTVGAADAVLDDSLFMAARWRAAGNRAALHVYPEATHLFLMQPSQMATVARARIAGFLGSCLSG